MPPKKDNIAALTIATILFIVLVLCSACLGEIQVAPSSEAYRVLPATIKADIPEAAMFNGGWKVSPGVHYLVHDRSTIHLTAPPGKHTITYSGYWVHVEEVVFKDGDGNEVRINSYLGSGQVDELAEFSVVGGAEPVPPQPPGPVEGPKHLVFFLEADNLEQLPYPQRYLVTSLQARKNLEARGHKILGILDDDVLSQNSIPDKWKSWADAVRGDPLPRIAIAPAEGGEVTDFPMPVDYKRLLELLGETP